MSEMKPLPKTALNEFRLSLRGPKPENGGKEATMRVSVIKNSPRIDVFTNVEGDNGPISAPMDAFTFFALLEKLREIIDGGEDTQVKITNKTGAPGKQTVLSTTVLGKDKDGRVYISIIAQNRPKIKFLFLPTDWHHLAHKDGTPLSERELTELYAKAWCRLFEQLVPNVLDTYFEESDYGKGGKGGRGKQYDKSGYKKDNDFNNGYNKKSFDKKPSNEPDFDDDNFPM